MHICLGHISFILIIKLLRLRSYTYNFLYRNPILSFYCFIVLPNLRKGIFSSFIVLTYLCLITHVSTCKAIIRSSQGKLIYPNGWSKRFFPHRIIAQGKNVDANLLSQSLLSNNSQNHIPDTSTDPSSYDIDVSNINKTSHQPSIFINPIVPW